MMALKTLTTMVFASALVTGLSSACSNSDLAGNAKTKAPVAPSPIPVGAEPISGNIEAGPQAPGAAPAPGPQAPGAPAPTVAKNAPTPKAPAPPTVRKCADNFTVPATANPYMAGVDPTTTLTYTLAAGDGANAVDDGQKDAAVLVKTASDCLKSGNVLSFPVVGRVSQAQGVAGNDGNGNLREIDPHQLGATLGKSGVTAPLTSLLGVFLTDADPSTAPAPADLDFSSQASRDYKTLSPLIGQVFFVGNGKTSRGDLHKVVVPAGATRLFFAVMDARQWNNNVGDLQGAVNVDITP